MLLLLATLLEAWGGTSTATSLRPLPKSVVLPATATEIRGSETSDFAQHSVPSVGGPGFALPATMEDILPNNLWDGNGTSESGNTNEFRPLETACLGLHEPVAVEPQLLIAEGGGTHEAATTATTRCS
ncbi:hypothetical protein Z517_09181 [Fonsecaea pedrosoi CBS 271.37]|uniref:Unplaced genomic scaffold supercont1.6, whole genome shotgun sequence n=1 Tax=Fonsecaea pedrosoi CBS 271.37 TaxID=1442368 RepID=A0A0D2ER44_9EURO|nr:uncharacterized protein Z517_09181 [Fonsecaea pedrosoi CBS 271.37]KIW76737.1 hypothetical protein Z517_09181 [Fonsecaea pedrosoi CBS 271.37]